MATVRRKSLKPPGSKRHSVACLKGSFAWLEWFDRLVKHTGLSKDEFLAEAVTFSALRHTFTEPQPER